jgi:hypothetical protein
MSEMVYGVVIDYHAPREDRGVPTFWDGWYSNRSDAEEALEHWKRRSPGARIHLVMQVDAMAQSRKAS